MAEDRAIRKIRATRGMASQIARACGINRQAVEQWKRVPAVRVFIVADLIKMSPEQIRPDIFRRSRL